MHDNNKPFVQSGESLSDFLRSFWRRQIDTAEQDTPDFRHPPLPLARIKKVMKSDPDVKVCLYILYINSKASSKLGNFLSSLDDCCGRYVQSPFPSVVRPDTKSKQKSNRVLANTQHPYYSVKPAKVSSHNKTKKHL